MGFFSYLAEFSYFLESLVIEFFVFGLCDQWVLPLFSYFQIFLNFRIPCLLGVFVPVSSAVVAPYFFSIPPTLWLFLLEIYFACYSENVSPISDRWFARTLGILWCVLEGAGGDIVCTPLPLGMVFSIWWGVFGSGGCMLQTQVGIISLGWGGFS